MLWKIIIARDSAVILATLLLMGATFSIYRLMKDDGGPIWNFILISTSFLAISAIFGVIKEYLIISIFNTLEHIFMMLSGIIFASILIFASFKERYYKVKNE